MSILLQPDQGETVIAQVPVPAMWHRGFRFGFAVTSSALYLAVKSLGFTLRDPLKPVRVPLSDIKRVEFSPADKRIALLILYGAASLIFCAAAVAVRDWFWIFWVLSLGLQLIQEVLGSSGRFQLKILTSSGSFDVIPDTSDIWLPRQKREAFEVQRALFQACVDAGMVPQKSNSSTTRILENLTFPAPRTVVIHAEELNCPYCKNPFDTVDVLAICSKCGTLHHPDCWESHSGCGIFGCGSKTYTRESTPMSQTHQENLTKAGCQKSRSRNVHHQNSD